MIHTSWSLLFLFISLFQFHPNLFNNELPDKEKRHLFEVMESITHTPWYYLAAMDQYEKNLRLLEKKHSIDSQRIFIKIPNRIWSGPLNPNLNDQVPRTIHFFEGIGQDGDGDNIADRKKDFDILYSVSAYLAKNGVTDDAIRQQLWHYYKHPTAVDIITHIAKVFQSVNKTNLDDKSFPIPPKYNYTYRSTWGARRGWGGTRIHEGTDIFADYGTPVLSTCYGFIELMGWNRYGGWRIGIRDVNNNYHYFGHLQAYRKGLKQGDIVKPGERIGTVGSSGYGPPGTSGKFPPHLHYGLYKFNGKKTYSFDPYAALKKWEKKTKKKAKKTTHSF